MQSDQGSQKPAGHSAFTDFLHSQVAGSVVLLVCTIAALAIANSPLADRYFDVVKTYVAVTWDGAPVSLFGKKFALSVQHWINDGLMVIFFFVVGLEIKREVVVGELSNLRKAALPVSAAIGGMLVPALIYYWLNPSGPASNGWGVPMATDIAFAIGLLSLFGSRVPTSLKVFLTALAIADDLGAIAVIAIFYTEKVSLVALAGSGLFLGAIVAINKLGVRQNWAYVLLALGAWAFVLASGVHATVAGILVAMLVPVKSVIDPDQFLRTARASLDRLQSAKLSRHSAVEDPAQMAALDDLFQTVDDMRPAGLALEHQLHPVQAFWILPIFAFFNAGVPLDGASVSAAVESPISWGIVLGLVVGKPIGVLLFSWLAVKSGRASLPDRVDWGQILAVGSLAGVGFTMSIFISELAFQADLVNTAKVGILVASVVSGAIGLLLLARSLPRANASSTPLDPT
ncbi:MAG: Na+/H+ antiporter NhaA [Planctomycetes bacterium]|nr:Na+/H+ antiporter NhaA [Planctomycetota bacterium]MCB9904085.1 Na+/H+ antiporter NhaA [Planctomycetota bacterium]